MGKRVSDAAIARTLSDCRGLVQVAAQRLGVHPSTLRRRVKSVPAVAAALQESRDLLVDAAEAKLAEAIDAGESWAIALTVRQLGRARGWGDSVALTGPNGGALQIEQTDYTSIFEQRMRQIHERLQLDDSSDGGANVAA